ncbi:MAG: hypothetical protein SNJ78_04375 [Spirochaetales bacterium]
MQILQIEKLVQGGWGLGRVEGKVFFVPQVLPGEEVEVQETEEKKNFTMAKVFRIIHPSPDRVTPLCSYFPQCGGCQFYHTAYATEVQIKKQIFKETFSKFLGCEFPHFSFHSGLWEGYRNRVRFHTQGTSLGFLASRSNSFVPVDFCRICVEEVNAFLDQVKRGKVLLGSTRKKELTLFGYGGTFFWEGGRKEVRVHLSDKEIYFPLQVFFQSNLGMLERLIVDQILPLSGNRILELYGGVGTFGIFLQDRCEEYTLVEEHPLATRYARKNLPGKQIHIFTGTVERWISNNSYTSYVDLLVLDPPRTGLSAIVRKYILSLRPKEILYVSCNPVTQARDLQILVRSGYSLDSVAVYDFYPRTSHLEVVCRLSLCS